MTVLTQRAGQRLAEIHRLSSRVNSGRKRPHRAKLLSLMREHAAEIEELARKGDPHCIIETGDLLILCLELILESGASPNTIIEECFDRYERKLTGILRKRRR